MDSDILRFVGIVVSLAVAGGLGYTIILLGGVMARRLEGRSGSVGMAEELAILQDQVAEVEVLRERVGALEERLDFTERLLTSSTRTPSDAGRAT